MGEKNKIFIPALTGLRAFAALAVMLFHYTKDTSLTVPVFGPLIQHGYLGVDLFFILSGFIIHHVYRTKFAKKITASGFFDFIRNRFARIYPVHLFTMLLMLGFFGASVLILHRQPEDPSAFTLPAILAGLFLVHGWLDIPSPNIPAWSVSAEWFAYVLYPLAGFCALRLGTAGRIILVICALLAIELTANAHPLLRICPEFVLGMMAYDLNAKISLGSRIGNFLGWLAAGLIVAAGYLLPGEQLALHAFLFAVLIMALANEHDRLGRLLAKPVAVYFGEISYSTYMVHGPVWAIAKNIARLFHMPVASFLLIGMTIALVLAASAALFSFVELPARRALRSGRRAIIETQTA